MIRVASETSRAIALIVHALRSSAWVRRLPTATPWLRHGAVAESQLLAQLAGGERHLIRWLAWAPVRALLLGALDLAVPGSSRHLLARKLWFHATAHAFLGRHRQVLCLGAGLDALGLRLATEFPDATICELDRADAMTLKRSFLARRHPDRTNLHCIDLDLDTDLANGHGLELAPLDADQPTLVLAEGLFMYLGEPALRTVLTELRRTLRGPLELAFSFLAADALADPDSGVARLRRTLARRDRGEGFCWAIAAGRLPGWLHDQGFVSRQTLSAVDLQRTAFGAAFGAATRRPDYGEGVALAGAARPTLGARRVGPLAPTSPPPSACGSIRRCAAPPS